MAQKHPVNLLNEKDLNQFIADIIYFGEKPDSFETAELRDLSYVKEHKDAVIRAMVYQWFKTRLRSFLTTDTEQNRVFLEPLNPRDTSYHKILEQYTADGQEPIWLRSCYEQGRKVYVFNQEKMPSEIKDEITNLRDFLYDDASKKVERAITVAEESQQGKKQKGGFRLRLDALKTDNTYKEYEQAKKASEIWHYKLTVQSAKLKNVYRDERGEEEIIQFADGMKIVRLFTPEALDYEGKKMGHCLGAGSYDRAVRKRRIHIYSLRDKRDNPHVTFEVRGKDIIQCKGKENCHPIRKYAPYCQFFVNQKGLSLCDDMRLLGLISQDGVCYDIYDLPENFVVKGDLVLRGMNLTELPDLSHVVVEGDFDCCYNRLKNLKGAPGVKGKIYVDEDEIETLEGYRFYQDGKWYDLYHLPENFVIKGDLNLDIIRANSGLDIPMWTLPNLSNVIVSGDFVCSYDRLQDLTGSPKLVGGCFNCSHNDLTSLSGAPQKVGGDFNCSYNQLQDLVGGPEQVSGGFNCAHNDLTSLSGVPEKVGGDFDCSHNHLQDLSECPEQVGGSFNCAHNDLKSLRGVPLKVIGDFNCSYNQLQDLIGSPKWVSGSFDCIHNSLTSLSGAPRKVGGDFNCRFCQMLSSVMGAPTVLDGTFYVDRTDLMQQLHYKNGRLQMGRILVKKENTRE